MFRFINPPLAQALLVCTLLFPVSAGCATAFSTPSPPSIATVPDSLAHAREQALREKNCTAAFALGVRQLSLIPSGEKSLDLLAQAFGVLAEISLYGGDTDNAVVFATAANNLAETLYPADSTRRSIYLLTASKAIRLSGQPGARERSASLLGEADKLVAGHILDGHLHADIIQARANLARATGDHAAAIALYRQALDIRLQGDRGHDLAVADNECWLAVSYLFAGDPDRAAASFLACLADLDALDLSGHSLAATALSHLAMIAQSRGDLKGAIDAYSRADSLLEQAQNNILPGFSRRRLSSPIRNDLSYLYIQEKDMEQAWQCFAAGHQAFMDPMQFLDQVRREDPERARRIRRAAIETARLRNGLGPVLQATAPGFTAEERTHAVVILAEYARQLSRSRSQLDALRQEFQPPPAAASYLKPIQSGLHDGQAILGYLNTYAQPSPAVDTWSTVNYAVVVRPGRSPVWVRLPDPIHPAGAEPDSPLRRYSRMMRKASEWPTQLPDDPALITLRHALFTRYFAPIMTLLADSREILLSSAGLGMGFPFPALIDDAGEPLVDHYAFRHLVGLDIRELNPRGPGLAGGRNLVLGDPFYHADRNPPAVPDPTLAQAITICSNTVLSRAVVNGVLAKGAEGLSALPPLPSSGWEARGIAQMATPVTLLTGREATEQNLNQACASDIPRTLHWIHIAAHALMHPALPERSALALSPRDGQGLLNVESIGAGWNLDCDLITLSGCQTGTGPVSWSSGPLGFIQVLHTAGARNMVLSTSKVDDIATALLMERFYADLTGNSSPRVGPAAAAPLSYSFALAEAQQWLQELAGPDGHRPFAHPVYWANFSLTGRGGPYAGP